LRNDKKREEQFNFVKKVVALMLLGLWFGFFAYLLIDSTRERLRGVPPLYFLLEPLIVSSPLILFVLIQLRDRNTRQIIYRTVSFSAGTILGFLYTYRWWYGLFHIPQHPWGRAEHLSGAIYSLILVLGLIAFVVGLIAFVSSLFQARAPSSLNTNIKQDEVNIYVT